MFEDCRDNDSVDAVGPREELSAVPHDIQILAPGDVHADVLLKLSAKPLVIFAVAFFTPRSSTVPEMCLAASR